MVQLHTACSKSNHMSGARPAVAYQAEAYDSAWAQSRPCPLGPLIHTLHRPLLLRIACHLLNCSAAYIHKMSRTSFQGFAAAEPEKAAAAQHLLRIFLAQDPLASRVSCAGWKARLLVVEVWREMPA